MGLSELIDIKWAPMRVPFRRRLQTLSALAWILTLVVGGTAGWGIWAALIYLFPMLRIPLLLYAGWIYYDRHTAITGKRRSKWVRTWSWWEYLTDYFPVKLVKTAELPPDKNYLLATFPHGVLSSGAFCAFTVDCCNFEESYPGLRSHLVTLPSHFQTPFLRELLLFIGILPSSAECIQKYLMDNEKGNAVSVLVGGASEALLTHPGIYKIYLNSRKGFVKLSLETGAPLVPVISFGEPELYDQVETEGTIFRSLQDLYKQFTGVAPLLFSGRGIFQYSFGVVPRRHPLHVVVGHPIEVEQNASPTKDQIDQLHSRFIKELQELFNTHKAKYISDEKTELIVV